MAEAAIDVIDIGPYLAGDPAGTRRVVGAVRAACERIGFLVIAGHGVARRAGAPGLRRVDGLLRPAAGGEARRALGRCGNPAGLQRARQQEPRAHVRARYATRSARAVLHRPARRLGRALPALPGRGQGLRPERVAGASSGAPRGLRRVLPGPGAARPRPDAHLRAGARPAGGLVRRRDRPPLQHLSEQPVSRALGRAAAGPAPHGPAHGFRKPHDPGGQRCARRPSGAVPRRRVARRAPGARATSSSTSAT